MTRWCYVVVLVALAQGWSAAPAEAQGSKSDAEPAAIIVPELPAMTIINADVSNVTRPGAVRDLGVQALNIITPMGTVRSGVSIEFTPRALGATRRMTAYEYRHSWGKRLWARLGFSFATTGEAAADEQKARTRMAQGLRFVLWDKDDPLRDKHSEDVQTKARAECAGEPALKQAQCVADAGERLLNELNMATQRERSGADRKWNSGGATLAVATSQVFTEGRLSAADFDAVAAWFNLAFGLRAFELAPSARVVWRSGDDWEWGGFLRARFGNEKLRGLVEGGALYTHQADNQVVGRVTLGAEVQLVGNTWLALSVGGNITEDDTAETVAQLFGLSSLQWALNQK